MPPDTLFSISNALVIPAWMLLALAPRWRWTQRIAALALPLILGTIYLLLIVTQFKARGGGGFGSLAAVRLLFSNPYLLLAGWIHYLAFDLFTGAWEARDALRNHVPMVAVWPCLVLTFLFGPIGLLSYLLVRAGTVRRLDLAP